MKIIQAEWELRNLGIRCIEITAEKSDSAEELKKALVENHADYMVAKMPVQRMDFYHVLKDLDYCFVESMVEIEKEMSLPVLRPDQAEKAKYLSYRLNQPEGRERVFSAIKDGLFTTDRISLDTHFTKEQAANRYVGMLSDELSRGGDLLEYHYKSEPIGFTCFRHVGDGIYYQSLSGLYISYRGCGFGFLPTYLPIKEMMSRNAVRVTSGISTNNIVSLRAHLRGGFYPTAVTNIFVKHHKED